MACLAAVAAIAIAGCGGDTSSDAAAEEPQSLPMAERPEIPPGEGLPPEKLTVTELWEGDGPRVKRGDEIRLQYYGVNWRGGGEHANSWRYQGIPTFILGKRTLLRGMNLGIVGMREGGAREIVIPHNLVYYPGVEHQRLGRLAALIYRVYLVKIINGQGAGDKS